VVARRFVAELEPAARRDLLRVLTSPSALRADVIRQFHEAREPGHGRNSWGLLEEKKTGGAGELLPPHGGIG
jgi:hypothetical protein